MAKKPAQHAPWLPPRYELADVYAVKAIVAGTADEDQQRRAMRWIIEQLCGTYEPSFRPEGDRETTFAEGRRFVGLQIVKLVNMSASVLSAMMKKAE